MTETSKLLKSTLKAGGASMTRIRQDVFNILDGKEPQSMAAIIKKAGGKADRASVYRTVDLFEKLGIVHRLNIGWKYKLELTDHFSHHHHHLACDNCGRIIPITEDSALELMIDAVAKQTGFFPTSHELEIRGLCADCRAGINK